MTLSDKLSIEARSTGLLTNILAMAPAAAASDGLGQAGGEGPGLSNSEPPAGQLDWR